MFSPFLKPRPTQMSPNIVTMGNKKLEKISSILIICGKNFAEFIISFGNDIEMNIPAVIKKITAMRTAKERNKNGLFLMSFMDGEW